MARLELPKTRGREKKMKKKTLVRFHFKLKEKTLVSFILINATETDERQMFN